MCEINYRPIPYLVKRVDNIVFFLPSWPRTLTEQTLKVIQRAATTDFTASRMFSHFPSMISRAAVEKSKVQAPMARDSDLSKKLSGGLLNIYYWKWTVNSASHWLSACQSNKHSFPEGEGHLEMWQRPGTTRSTQQYYLWLLYFPFRGHHKRCV